MRKIFTTCFAVLATFIFVGMSTAPATANVLAGRYVALGDSVAAGAGLPLKDDTPESRACGRSSQAYPLAVAAALGVPLELVACGGATVPQGISGPQTTGGLTFAAQIEQAYRGPQPPTHITLTVGTNDIKWSQFIGKCYVSTCGTWQDTLAVIQLQSELFANLRAAMGQIRQQHISGQPLPVLVLTGYFQPLATNQPACADTQGLTADEIQWVRAQARLLNTFIQSVAALQSFAHFAPVDFSGHELCSPQPWVQGLHDPAAYHPTLAGQQAIAGAVVRAFQE